MGTRAEGIRAHPDHVMHQQQPVAGADLHEGAVLCSGHLRETWMIPAADRSLQEAELAWIPSMACALLLLVLLAYSSGEQGGFMMSWRMLLF